MAAPVEENSELEERRRRREGAEERRGTARDGQEAESRWKETLLYRKLQIRVEKKLPNAKLLTRKHFVCLVFLFVFFPAGFYRLSRRRERPLFPPRREREKKNRSSNFGNGSNWTPRYRRQKASILRNAGERRVPTCVCVKPSQCVCV